MTPAHDQTTWIAVISSLVFLAVFIFVAFGWRTFVALLRQREALYDRVLVQELMLEIRPRTALVLSILAILVFAAAGYFIAQGWPWAILGAAAGYLAPTLVVKHLEQKRQKRLEKQLVDAITSLASGVRAGLNLVQSIEHLVKNSTPPIKQEMGQMLREYQMGLDLNQAMRNAAERIGSPHFRLLFTAIEMHRLRGGDAAESLDRIAASIRQIQKLEDFLDTQTAPGRIQANMMAGISGFLLLIFYSAYPEGVSLLFSEPRGRILLLVVTGMMALGFAWIRRIVSIDI